MTLFAFGMRPQYARSRTRHHSSILLLHLRFAVEVAITTATHPSDSLQNAGTKMSIFLCSFFDEMHGRKPNEAEPNFPSFVCVDNDICIYFVGSLLLRLPSYRRFIGTINNPTNCDIQKVCLSPCTLTRYISSNSWIPCWTPGDVLTISTISQMKVLSVDSYRQIGIILIWI